MPTKRKSDCSPEEYALIRERAKAAQKRYEHTEKGRAANRRKSKAKWARKGDEMRAKKREYERRMRIEKPERHKALALRKRIKNPEAARKRERRRYWRAASPKRARELMLELYRMVPQVLSRDEIVAEAAMLVMEGVKVGEAVETARKKTINSEYHQKFNKQIKNAFGYSHPSLTRRIGGECQSPSSGQRFRRELGPHPVSLYASRQRGCRDGSSSALPTVVGTAKLRHPGQR